MDMFEITHTNLISPPTDHISSNPSYTAQALRFMMVLINILFADAAYRTCTNGLRFDDTSSSTMQNTITKNGSNLSCTDEGLVGGDGLYWREYNCDGNEIVCYLLQNKKIQSNGAFEGPCTSGDSSVDCDRGDNSPTPQPNQPPSQWTPQPTGAPGDDDVFGPPVPLLRQNQSPSVAPPTGNSLTSAPNPPPPTDPPEPVPTDPPVTSPTPFPTDSPSANPTPNPTDAPTQLPTSYPTPESTTTPSYPTPSQTAPSGVPVKFYVPFIVLGGCIGVLFVTIYIHKQLLESNDDPVAETCNCSSTNLTAPNNNNSSNMVFVSPPPAPPTLTNNNSKGSVFASMRFRNGNCLPEAIQLRNELQKHGYDMLIINMRAGDDIDKEVFYENLSIQMHSWCLGRKIMEKIQEILHRHTVNISMPII